MHSEHEAEKKKMLRDGRKEMAEATKARKNRDAQIAALQRELSKMERKCNLIEIEKTKVSDDLMDLKRADSWSRRSPKKAMPGFGQTPVRNTPIRKRVPTTPSSGRREKTVLERKVESDRALRELNSKMAAIQKENRSLKQELEHAQKTEAPKSNRSDALAKQNATLSAHARRLTTKTKALEGELVKTRAEMLGAQKEAARFRAAATKAANEARTARVNASKVKAAEPKVDPQLEQAYASRSVYAPCWCVANHHKID